MKTTPRAKARLAAVLYGISGVPAGFSTATNVLGAEGGYLTFSFATLLTPPFAARLYPYLPFVTALLGEGSLMLWLGVKGVNAQRWEEQATAAAGRGD